MPAVNQTSNHRGSVTAPATGTTGGATSPLSYEGQVRLLRDQKMEELRLAMEAVWRVKEDVERTFGKALGGGAGGADGISRSE